MVVVVNTIKKKTAAVSEQPPLEKNFRHLFFRTHRFRLMLLCSTLRAG